ncbi:hypothetical protein CONPUDRAFT_119547 [Coniophora puteana RWD-64-598 SS2]|uniref:G domain-containing protein n=1 Tax=Coniophora puteana (strain RWD-64-598) TaxID=741705 RepID=A0A5M3MYA4_CONPW|nr:uncharacterized protein CONPUDRAFT_119547 [Coniophora puteana RWD-64-598 SS2]EIW84007.1 hypothetical protein CONPUDRAFT_119547 [Coniophora puteana RWD-64-598 SS2]
MYIAVMGSTGSGKTTFINAASGSSLRIGTGLESCTNEVQTSRPFNLDGRSVVLIDTPGFDDTTKSDTDVLRLIATSLVKRYEHGTKLAGIIYLHRISDIRMGGTSSRNFRMFRELCGEKTLKNVVVLTNMWNEVSPEVGAAREHELADKDKFFKPVIDKGARMLRHTDTKESAHAVLRYLVNMQPATLQIQDELVNQHKEIGQTAAGSELSHELKEQADKHERELQALREEMLAALRAKDDEAKEELRAEMLRKQAEIERVQRESMHLVESYRTQKEKLDAQIHEMEEKHRKQEEARARQATEAEKKRREAEEEEKRRQKQKEEQEREIERARLQAEHERALRDMQLKLEKATRQAEEERKAREAKETREAYDRALEEERRKHSLSFDSIPYILVSGFLGWLRR